MLRLWQLWWLSEYLTITMINAVNQDVLFYATNVYNWIWYVTVGMSRKIHCINVSTLIKLTVLFFAIFIIYRQVFLSFPPIINCLWLIEFGLNRIPQLAVLPHASHTPVDTGSQLLPPHRGGLRHLCFEAVCPKHRISCHGSIPLMFLLSRATCHLIFYFFLSKNWQKI